VDKRRGGRERRQDRQQERREGRPGEGAGGAPAGVVVHSGGDHSRTDHGQEDGDLAPGEAPPRPRGRSAYSRSFFCHAIGRTSVRMSSTVIMPTRTPFSSTTGTAARLYFSMTAATSETRPSG